jgi:hypothetical protein
MRSHLLTLAFALSSIGLIADAALAAKVAVPADKCNAAWTLASPNGDTIAKGADVPFVLDFVMVDSSKDGSIQADEFNKACAAGKVTADEAVVKDMK